MPKEPSHTFEALINPTKFIEAEFEKKPSVDDLINYLCSSSIPDDIESLVSRYKEIAECDPIFCAPHEDHILNNIVWPLKHAKSSFILGNYLGTIALCGMVAEMIAILLYEISEFTVGGKPLEADTEEDLFGKNFESLQQYRRVRVLRSVNIIPEGDFKLLEEIRKIRNRHLHVYSREEGQIVVDAKEIFRKCATLVANVMGQNVKEGKIILNPAIIKYLVKKGLAHATPEAPTRNL